MAYYGFNGILDILEGLFSSPKFSWRCILMIFALFFVVFVLCLHWGDSKLAVQPELSTAHGIPHKSVSCFERYLCKRLLVQVHWPDIFISFFFH